MPDFDAADIAGGRLCATDETRTLRLLSTCSSALRWES